MTGKEGEFMSKWDDFKKSVGYYADKTVTKTRELTDSAALKIKIASREADRDTEYKNLGRLTYSKLKSTTGADQEKLTLEISETMDRLERIIAEINTMRAEEDGKRNAKADKDSTDPSASDEDSSDDK